MQVGQKKPTLSWRSGMARMPTEREAAAVAKHATNPPLPLSPGRVLRRRKKTLSLRYKGCPKTYAGFLLWELSIPNSARIARAIPNRTLVIPKFGVHVHQNRVFGPKIAIFGHF